MKIGSIFLHAAKHLSFKENDHLTRTPPLNVKSHMAMQFQNLLFSSNKQGPVV